MLVTLILIGAELLEERKYRQNENHRQKNKK